MTPIIKRITNRRVEDNNVWLEYPGAPALTIDPSKEYNFEVLADEDSIGRAMFAELVEYAGQTTNDIVMVLLGGRGAQSMYRKISVLAKGDTIDSLLGRLHVFTQDALAPMRMDNSLSFVRDFERLLGEAFFQKIKSFTPMLTETDDIEGSLIDYLDKLNSLGGIDLFYLGLGPEANAASHLCYIKPESGARYNDFAGIIPISDSILEHHINKFKIGGSAVSEADETECRRATHILTLGPAAILSAKKVVQSIVDASTAPAKRESFARMIATDLAEEKEEIAMQLDENPGLWIRLHANVKSFVLPDLL